MRALVVCLLFAAAPAGAAETILTFDGDVPATGDYFWIPFDVTPGTVEIEVRHDDLSTVNILDWGLFAPGGLFRGYGGGNTEPAVVGVAASSRSYLTGPIPAGPWRVMVGKAKVTELPARYHVDVVLRDAPTLPPQPERRPYAPAKALATGPRWYAGDLHTHSRDSGDARPTLDAMAALARTRGLDFLHISDHNTTSQLDFFADAQSRHPDLLFLPGVEFTTYAGHAGGIGATRWVDHKIGFEGATIEAAARAFADQGALFSINHPALELGDACIGCAWKHSLSPDLVAAVEIETGGWKPVGFLFTPSAIAFWDQICAGGHHIAAVGGSDDHTAGVDEGPRGSPIGDPTTMVYASELSTAALIEGIRAGRTVVKLQGPGDPMVELDFVGDTVGAHTFALHARVTGGNGTDLRFVKNGEPLNAIAVTADPFTTELKVVAPPSGQDRYRAQLYVDGETRVVTSHLWLEDGPAGAGCGCSLGAAPRRGSPWLLLGLCLLSCFRLPRLQSVKLR